MVRFSIEYKIISTRIDNSQKITSIPRYERHTF